MVKIIVGVWVIWFIYSLMELIVPAGIYQPLESMVLISALAIQIGGHVLTFCAIRSNNKKIVSATHNSQQTILFRREEKAFKNMTFYTVATLLTLIPVVVVLNLERTIISGNILLPWAVTCSQLISSFNPAIQIQRNAALREALKMVFWK